MAWLNVIPKLLQYQVSSELLRIMLGTATLVPVNNGCLTKSGPFSEADKAQLQALDLADCKKCGKWMACRSVNSKQHKQVCKNNQHEAGEAGSEDSDADVPLKHGWYSVYSDSLPQFVYDALEAGGDLGTWLHDLDGWSGVDGAGVASGASLTVIGVYLLAPQSL